LPNLAKLQSYTESTKPKQHLAGIIPLVRVRFPILVVRFLIIFADLSRFN